MIDMQIVIIIVSILGVCATGFVIWLNFKHRTNPNIVVDSFPCSMTLQTNPTFTLRNVGDSIKIKRILSMPNDFIQGLPSKYTDNWNQDTTKTYALSNEYFPLRKKVKICIIVEDCRSYRFCVFLSYNGSQLIIDNIVDYNFVSKMIMWYYQKKFDSPISEQYMHELYKGQ